MSTLKVNSIQNATGTTAVTLDASGNATFAGTVVSNSSMGMRNRIINGDMRIDQRNAGASVTPANVAATYLTDRFRIYKDSGATITSQQSTTAPTGFTNSLLFTVSTGSSPTSAQEQLLMHTIEGYNIADLGWGTANAQTVTLSFRVRSSVTGTFAGALQSSSAGRNYVFNYTILAANTWETKTITIAGDTSGTWLTTNGTGITVIFDLGSGSNYETTANTWGTGNKYRTSGAVQLATTTGATFYITGVQLEIGTSATPFERRLYGQELINCQRYYEKGFPIDTAVSSANALYWNGGGLGATAYATNLLRTLAITYRVEKRATPTVTLYQPGALGSAGNLAYYNGSWAALTTSSIERIGSSTNNFNVRSSATSTTGVSYIIDGAWTADAEL